MPELPEVETVRRGLQAHVTGRTITAVRVHHPRAVRRHEAGPADLAARLIGQHISGTGRRGKYLWLTCADGPVLVVHLGMSGQMLLGKPPRDDHVRITHCCTPEEDAARLMNAAEMNVKPICDQCGVGFPASICMSNAFTNHKLDRYLRLRQALDETA